MENFANNFVISGVNYFRDAFFRKIWQIFVSEILTLGEINLQALWDSGDEFLYKSKNCTVGTCGDHAEQKIVGFSCHIISKTWQKDSGFFVFEIWSEIDMFWKISLVICGFFVMLKNMAIKNLIWENFSRRGLIVIKIHHF